MDLNAIKVDLNSQQGERAKAIQLISSPVSIGQNLTQAANNQGNDPTVKEDPFWAIPNIDSSKWDRLCPYQLVVVVQSKDEAGNLTYAPVRQFTMPLPPDSISKSIPYAIETTVTLGGIVEEHNAAPIIMFDFAGSFGMLPSRASGGDRSSNGGKDQLESIFGGVVNVVRNAVNAGTQIASTLSGSGPKASNVYQSADFVLGAPDPTLPALSGFVQMGLLEAFLHSYATLKKSNSERAKITRLALAIWKTNEVFLVTPQSLQILKNSTSPMESRYSLRFKAWKSITLNSSSLETKAPTAIRKSPNAIAAALNVLTDARTVVQELGALNQAIQGTVDYVMRPLNDAILLAKDSIGAYMSLADIPEATKARININWKSLHKQYNSLKDQYKAAATSNTYAEYINKMAGETDAPVGITGRKTTVSPLTQMPAGLAEMIPISVMVIPDAVRNDMQANLQRVRNIGRKDFEDYVSSMQSAYDKICFLFGAGDPDYSNTYGISVKPIKKFPTQNDWNSMAALANAIEAMQALAATADGDVKAPTLLDRFGDLAAASGIAWTKPVSKFSVPFPQGATLETLALQYLGDANRFMEIAALNGLRSPFVDEAGYSLDLLVDAKSSTILVNYNNDLFCGKSIWLSSQAMNRRKFKILSIDTVDGKSTLKLDGDATGYRLLDKAKLQAFLTGTTNSSMLIWIPSQDQPADTDSLVTKDVPGVNASDPYSQVGCVDWLVGAGGDFVLSGGDLKLVSGLASIVQWVKGVLSIRKNELLQHPDVGLDIAIGSSLADFDAKQLVESVRSMLTGSSLFSQIDKIQVVQKAAGSTISISATPAGTSKPLPLTYGVNLN